jgi:haloalkane dehalogenase
MCRTPSALLRDLPEAALRRRSRRLIAPVVAEKFAKGLKNRRFVQLRSGIHYLQEDHPDVIGANIKEWLIEIGIGSSPGQKLTL